MPSIAGTDLQELSKARVVDAGVLLTAKRYSASYYLCGYAIELALKAVIAKNFNKNAIPDKRYVNEIYTHDLSDLLKLAGLAQSHNQKKNDDNIFSQYWGIVTQWEEISRYELTDVFRANAMYKAVQDSDHGVHKWITQFW